jgi:predicted transcriptional regulator
MDIQNWIIAQLVIDAVLGFCILLFIRSYMKSKKTNNDIGDIFQKPENIISEMQELTRQLDRNLEEKKELSRVILNQLDDGLKRAEETFNQLQGVVREFGTKGVNTQDIIKDREKIWSSVSSLLAKGLSKEEIAQHIGISVSEIELLLKFHKQTKKD